MEELTHGDLLTRAASGDQVSWNALVERFAPLVWSVARGFRLDEATARDVSQTVWLKLVEHCDRIRDPERLPGWLATTTRREAIRVLKARGRMIPSDFEYDVADPAPSLDSMLIEDEETRSVVEAYRELSDDCQQLLRLLTVEPALSYEEIAGVLGRPVGSLGPTRSRCIERLKRTLETRGIS